jgi:hypothetical protein
LSILYQRGKNEKKRKKRKERERELKWEKWHSPTLNIGERE